VKAVEKLSVQAHFTRLTKPIGSVRTCEARTERASHLLVSSVLPKRASVREMGAWDVRSRRP
jgi:hypothetical protein